MEFSLPVRSPILAVFCFAAVLASCNPIPKTSWDLPISLGQSVADVRHVLGAPKEVIDDSTMAGFGKNVEEGWKQKNRGRSEEWYYSSGIVASFDGDRLFKVDLYRHANYPSFLPYAGKIVEGISLSDSRESLLGKLGDPTKVEENPKISGFPPEKKTNLASAAVWPAQQVYYWRRSHYTIEALFLKQPQTVDEKRGLVWPAGEVMYIKVYQ